MNSVNNSGLKKQNYTLPIVMMIALFFMISFVTGLPNPLGVIVKNQFGASNLMSTLGNFANFFAYLFMGIPSGMLLERIGYKKTALLAVIVGFTGVGIQFISGQAGSFMIYLTGAFVSGFSMCMLNSVVNPMLNTLGGGGKTGNQLIQVGGSVNSVGATIVPVLVGILMGDVAKAKISDANPALFIAMGIFALVFIVLYFVDIPEPHMAVAEKKKEKDKHSALSFRHFILGTVAIFVYVGVEVGIPNISNLYMTTYTTEQAQEISKAYKDQQAQPALLDSLKKVDAANVDTKDYTSKVVSPNSFEKAEKVSNGEIFPGLGINATTAGTVVGLYWFLMMIGRLFGAALGAKFSSKSMLTFVSTLGLVFVLIAIFSPVSLTISLPGLASVPISILFLVLTGFCTSIMWGGIFNLAVEGLGKYTAMASGIFMVMVFGGAVLPAIQGFVADKAGFMASYWVIIAGLAYMLYYALIGSKNVNKDIITE